MAVRQTLKSLLPAPVTRAVQAVRRRLTTKNDAELDFWRTRPRDEQGRFHNAHYQRLLLAMAERPDDEFLRGKVVADFGCGPRGSLVWAEAARLRIGIDVLADRYADAFTDDILSHGMIYLKSTERVIPLPADFVDVLFTLNAIDHVDHFARMCDELIRVLKPGGEFIGSFNLEQPPTSCEPQCLTEAIIQRDLLSRLTVASYRVTAKGPAGNQYAPFFDGTLSYSPGEEGILWVRATKPA